MKNIKGLGLAIITMLALLPATGVMAEENTGEKVDSAITTIIEDNEAEKTLEQEVESRVEAMSHKEAEVIYDALYDKIGGFQPRKHDLPKEERLLYDATRVKVLGGILGNVGVAFIMLSLISIVPVKRRAKKSEYGALGFGVWFVRGMGVAGILIVVSKWILMMA